MNITVEQMIAEMPELAKIAMPPRSKISIKNFISLLYYQQKAKEVWNRCRDTDWAHLMVCLEAQRYCLSDGSVGYDYWNESGDFAKRNKGGHHGCSISTRSGKR